MFRDAWDQLKSQSSEMRKILERNVTETERSIDHLVQRAMQVSNPRLVAAYERNIESLENERLVLLEKLENPGRTEHSFDSLFELSMQFLSSPCKFWHSGKIDLQKMVLRLVFSEPPKYSRENGFLNSKFSLPFNMLGGKPTLCLANGAHGVN